MKSSAFGQVNTIENKVSTGSGDIIVTYERTADELILVIPNILRLTYKLHKVVFNEDTTVDVAYTKTSNGVSENLVDRISKDKFSFDMKHLELPMVGSYDVNTPKVFVIAYNNHLEMLMLRIFSTYLKDKRNKVAESIYKDLIWERKVVLSPSYLTVDPSGHLEEANIKVKRYSLFAFSGDPTKTETFFTDDKKSVEAFLTSTLEGTVQYIDSHTGTVLYGKKLSVFEKVVKLHLE